MKTTSSSITTTLDIGNVYEGGARQRRHTEGMAAALDLSSYHFDIQVERGLRQTQFEGAAVFGTSVVRSGEITASKG